MKQRFYSLIAIVVMVAIAAVLNFSVLAFAASAPSTAEWEKTVAAAKREGKIVIIGPQGNETREALVEGFQRKYPEIKVDHSGMAGAQLPPKLLAEQKAGRYVVDLLVQGTTTIIHGLLPVNAVIPLRPFLVGPNTADPSVWFNKKFSFADEAGQYNMVMSVYIEAPFIYNPTMVSDNEIKAWKDLLAPKWKGKLAAQDPRQSGGGQGWATYWYANPKLGKEFIKKLFGSQEILLSRNSGQLLDFVGQGKYAIAIGPSGVMAKDRMEKGVPLRHYNPEGLQEGARTTCGNGDISVPRNPPHPNALKVYIDYLLSKQGQTEWSKAVGFASLRRDVPRDHIADYLIPKEGVQYMDSHLERYVNMRTEVVEFLNTVIGR